ncbi:MAG: hypothetical protein ACRC4N_03485, partial [Gammaproteobacteria bacterium]
TKCLMFKIHKCIMDCECANRLSCVNRPGFVISDWPRLFHDANLSSGTAEIRAVGLSYYFIS